MIVLMGLAFFFLAVWAVPEIIGIVSPAAEDTFSEWVFDLPWYGVLAVSGLFLIAGVLFVWSAGHFIEGFRRRKR